LTGYKQIVVLGFSSLMREEGPGMTKTKVAVLRSKNSAWTPVSDEDFEVVVDATSWVELICHPSFPAELTVLDIEAIPAAKVDEYFRFALAGKTKVLVGMDALATPEMRRRVQLSGARGAISRSASWGSVLKALGQMTSQPVRQSAEELEPAAGTSFAPRQTVKPQLSPNEDTAFRLYVTGHSTSEVADEMNVQFETAKTYLRRVREKYARVNRPAGRKRELVARAVEDGYLSGSQGR
jgi:DNA-binding NarL/FixJ family response regulator